MSTFKCNCGELISDVQYPADFDYVVLQQRKFDTMLQVVGRRLASFVESESRSAWIELEFGPEYPKDAVISEVAEDLITRELTSSSQHMFRCPKCKRLFLQQDSGSDNYDEFLTLLDDRHQNNVELGN